MFRVRYCIYFRRTNVENIKVAIFAYELLPLLQLEEQDERDEPEEQEATAYLETATNRVTAWTKKTEM